MIDDLQDFEINDPLLLLPFSDKKPKINILTQNSTKSSNKINIRSTNNQRLLFPARHCSMIVTSHPSFSGKEGITPEIESFKKQLFDFFLFLMTNARNQINSTNVYQNNLPEKYAKLQFEIISTTKGILAQNVIMLLIFFVRI